MAKSGKNMQGRWMPPFDAEAMLQRMERGLARKRVKDMEAAADLFYDAMTAPTVGERFDLLRVAEDFDPGNVDVQLALLKHFDLPTEAEIEVLRRIVGLAGRQLGRKAFKELAGEFWGFFETRPYMRARACLAEALYAADRVEEAVVEWEGMLELNPNDNQAARYMLLVCYLGLSRVEDAHRLFNQYAEFGFSTVFTYGWVLERYLSGDEAGAARSLAEARKQNPHTESYLRNLRRKPGRLPPMYTPGSKEEASCFAELLQTAWAPHKAARKWLAAQPTMPEEAAKRPPRPKKKGG